MTTSEAPLTTELSQLLHQLAIHIGYSDSASAHHLQTIFRVIRQHSSFENAIKFNDMLPLPLKALFLDEWHTLHEVGKPFKSTNQLALAVVQESNGTIHSSDEARQLIRKVLTFLGQLASPQQMKEGLSFLPSEFRSLLVRDPSLKYAYSDACIWLS